MSPIIYTVTVEFSRVPYCIHIDCRPLVSIMANNIALSLSNISGGGGIRSNSKIVLGISVLFILYMRI